MECNLLELLPVVVVLGVPVRVVVGVNCEMEVALSNVRAGGGVGVSWG